MCIIPMTVASACSVFNVDSKRFDREKDCITKIKHMSSDPSEVFANTLLKSRSRDLMH